MEYLLSWLSEASPGETEITVLFFLFWLLSFTDSVLLFEIGSLEWRGLLFKAAEAETGLRVEN